MFNKIVLLTAVVAVSCEPYRVKNHYPQEAPKGYKYEGLKDFSHEAPKEYTYRPLEHIPYKEAPVTEEKYKSPEGHGHAYSSQSVVHHGQAAVYQESHESNENVAPVYQYVDEQNEEQNAHYVAPVKHKYHAVHYPAPAPVQHEIQTVQVPHHKIPSYQSESHENVGYHQEIPNSLQHGQHEVPVHHVAESHESHDEPIDYYAYPKYQYEYKVEDPHTGDNKFQHEIRDGDVVKGVYGLHEADGSIRTVEYSSDKHKGFSAIVKHSAPGQHVHIETHHKNEE